MSNIDACKLDTERSKSLVIMTKRWALLCKPLEFDSLSQHHTLAQLICFLAENLLPWSTARSNGVAINAKHLPPLGNLFICDENVDLTFPQVNTESVTIFQNCKISSSRSLGASIQYGR